MLDLKKEKKKKRMVGAEGHIANKRNTRIFDFITVSWPFDHHLNSVLHPVD